jgi:hypothetical protein
MSIAKICQKYTRNRYERESRWLNFLTSVHIVERTRLQKVFGSDPLTKVSCEMLKKFKIVLSSCAVILINVFS